MLLLLLGRRTGQKVIQICAAGVGRRRGLDHAVGARGILSLFHLAPEQLIQHLHRDTAAAESVAGRRASVVVVVLVAVAEIVILRTIIRVITVCRCSASAGMLQATDIIIRDVTV